MSLTISCRLPDSSCYHLWIYHLLHNSRNNDTVRDNEVKCDGSLIVEIASHLPSWSRFFCCFPYLLVGFYTASTKSLCCQAKSTIFLVDLRETRKWHEDFNLYVHFTSKNNKICTLQCFIDASVKFATLAAAAAAVVFVSRSWFPFSPFHYLSEQIAAFIVVTAVLPVSVVSHDPRCYSYSYHRPFGAPISRSSSNCRRSVFAGDFWYASRFILNFG